MPQWMTKEDRVKKDKSSFKIVAKDECGCKDYARPGTMTHSMQQISVLYEAMCMRHKPPGQDYDKFFWDPHTIHVLGKELGITDGNIILYILLHVGGDDGHKYVQRTMKYEYSIDDALSLLNETYR